MGRSGCSSCCAAGDPPKRPDCVLDDNVFMYTLAQGGELLTEDYIDKLAQNQRTHQHESLTRVTQFINKRDYGEYRTELNAFSWSGDTGFDVTSHDRVPKGLFNFDFLKTIPGKDAGYLVPKKFTIKIGAHGPDGKYTGSDMSITRELKVKSVDFVSSGQNYGIADWQFTAEGVGANKGEKDRFPEDAIEKGCPNEGTLQHQYGEDIGAVFGEAAMDASRNGSIFGGFPRDRTNIQIVRTTFSLGYEQTVTVPHLYMDASGPTTIFRGIPIYVEYRAYNFGQELFIRGQSCGFSSFTSRCGDPPVDFYTKWGGPYVIDTEKLIEDEGTITEFLEEYRTLTYCLTYPFLKMEDGTYWFDYRKGSDGYRDVHRSIPYVHGHAEPDPRTGGAMPNKALQGTHHWTLNAMTSIKIDCENFFWLNPFSWDRWTTPTPANNDVLGKTLTANDWNTRFLLGGKPATPAPVPDGIPPPPPEAGEDEEAYEKYKKELRDLLVEKEQKIYIEGPYFELVDNKLKGNEYDIPQKMYMHVKEADKLYNVYDQITTGADPMSPPNDFNRSLPGQPNHTWKKWHENIIIVQIRSGRSAADWFGRSTVNGATVRVGDEVYHPVGECDKKTITQVNTGVDPFKPKDVFLNDGTLAQFNEIELLKDTITYGMDGRVYRMWMWLESELNGNTFVSNWYPVPEPDCHLDGTCPTERYTPLTHKIKRIWYHNHTRPFPVGPEVSSHNEYPYNDTVINFTDEISFTKMVGKDRNFAATALSLDNIGPCSTDPAVWRFDYNEFDKGDNISTAAVTKNFYYLNGDNKPEARLISDDDVIVMGKKKLSELLEHKVICGGDNQQHWHLPSWIYYSAYLEPEYKVDRKCRPNPLKGTYKHEFEKSQDGSRIPYIKNGKKQDAKFEITQTPSRGYLFTGKDYTIRFEFETIEAWKNRILGGQV